MVMVNDKKEDLYFYIFEPNKSQITARLGDNGKAFLSFNIRFKQT